MTEKIEIVNNPIGEKKILVYPKKVGTAPINKATVNNPNAIPLFWYNKLLRAISVIGIVILKAKMARIPIILM